MNILNEYQDKYGYGHKMYFVWWDEKCVWCNGHKNGSNMIIYNMEYYKMHTIWIVLRKMCSISYILYWNGALIDDIYLLSWKNDQIWTTRKLKCGSLNPTFHDIDELS